MTRDELHSLQDYVPARRRVPNPGGEDRTLLHGRDYFDRLHHVYLKDGEVHQVIYSLIHPLRDDCEIHHYAVGDEIDVGRVVPDKQLMPEACDLEFCKALRDLGLNMRFKPFRKACAYEGVQFFGHVFEEGLSPKP